MQLNGLIPLFVLTPRGSWSDNGTPFHTNSAMGRFQAYPSSEPQLKNKNPCDIRNNLNKYNKTIVPSNKVYFIANIFKEY